MSVCVNHPDRAGTARCSTCHKPVCSECVVKSNGANFCSQTCVENHARFNANFRPDKGPGFFGELKNIVVSVVGFAFVLAIIVYLCGKFLNVRFFADLLKKVGL